MRNRSRALAGRGGLGFRRCGLGVQALVDFHVEAVVGAAIAREFFFGEAVGVRVLEFAVGAVGEAEEVPDALQNIVRAPAIVHGGEGALFFAGGKELAEEAFFALEMRLVLHHGVRRLHVVRNEAQKAEEVALGLGGLQ